MERVSEEAKCTLVFSTSQARTAAVRLPSWQGIAHRSRAPLVPSSSGAGLSSRTFYPATLASSARAGATVSGLAPPGPGPFGNPGCGGANPRSLMFPDDVYPRYLGLGGPRRVRRVRFLNGFSLLTGLGSAVNRQPYSPWRRSAYPYPVP